MIPVASLVAIYLAFVAKHFIADYVLQTLWMVEGKERRTDWVRPLAAHAGIHALGTLLLALVFAPSLWWLAAVDFIVHGMIDRSKAVVTRRLQLSPAKTGFWWSLGADQALHQVTHFVFVLALATA